MRPFLIASFVIALFACSNSDSTNQKDVGRKEGGRHSVTVPKPVIVPVPDEQVAKEYSRLESNSKSKGRELKHVVNNMRSRALERYGNKPVFLVVAGTDSMSGGLDGWRTCAKFGVRQLGLPDDTIATFNDQNGASCENNPNGYVSQIVIVGLEGIGEKIGTPVYKTEKMTVVVSNVMTMKNE